ncbi:MAG: hypothetical protein WCL44_02890 [bacterium]
MPELDQWLAWRDKGALALCPSAMQTALQTFVHGRFCRYARQYAPAFSADGAASLPQQDCWHWFETYFQLHPNRQGRSYKEWLFARRGGGNSMTIADDVESGVSLLLRDVVRDYLRREHSNSRVFSLDAGAGAGEDGAALSVKDLLPDELDTTDEVERREFEEIAAGLADSVIGALGYRERLALLGREVGLSLANPVILRLAGCGKSILAVAHRSALKIVAGCVAGAFPDEPEETKATLTVAVFDIVKGRLVAWAKSEESISCLFNLAGVKASGMPLPAGAPRCTTGRGDLCCRDEERGAMLYGEG